MATIRAYIDGERFGQQFSRATTRFGNKINKGLREAAKTAADEILFLGGEDIADAGNFGDRWTEGLHADVSEGGGNIRINVWHEVPYFNIFEYGGTIQGKPLLWIPFSDAEDAQGLWPRAYPGPLFRVDSKEGLPILFTWDPDTKGSKAEAKYFGKEEVFEPQKFHIRDIVRKVASQYKDYFAEAMDKS